MINFDKNLGILNFINRVIRIRMNANCTEGRNVRKH